MVPSALRRRSPLAALLLLGVLSGPAAPPAAADAGSGATESTPRSGMSGPIPRAPRSFVGVVADDALWGTATDPGGKKTLAGIRSLGAGTVRVPFLWSRIEPAPGRVDLELYDGFVERAARAGLSVLPVLFDPPAHRSSRPAHGAARGTYPPADNRDFARMAVGLVRRYGPRGSFWRQHRAVPPRPIRAWQIWNEPNLRQFWPAGPNPAAYAAMLKTVGPAIRRVDRRAEIVTAGLNESPTGIAMGPFLRGMYRAGARGSFTTLGLHPYAPTSNGVIAQLRRARAVIRRHGDRAAIRVTEIGWATGGPSPRRRVSQQAQARLTRQTMARLLRLRRTFRLNGVVLYNWRDAQRNPSDGGDYWGLHAGLLTEDGRPKPVVGELVSLLRRVLRR